MVHGDFSPFNVLVDPMRPDYVTGIIDFGDVVRTPVIFDLSVTMANLWGRIPKVHGNSALHVMDGFLSIRPLPARELEALIVSAKARLLLRALITQWRASQLPQRRDYLLSHSKPDWERLAFMAASSRTKFPLHTLNPINAFKEKHMSNAPQTIRKPSRAMVNGFDPNRLNELPEQMREKYSTPGPKSRGRIPAFLRRTLGNCSRQGRHAVRPGRQ